MKTDDSKNITIESMSCLLILTVLGTNFLDTPHEAVSTCGASGYWTAVIGFLFSIPVLLLFLALRRRFPTQNLLQVSRLSLGKTIGSIGNLIFLSVFLFWTILALAHSVSLTRVYLLNDTPKWISATFFMIGTGFTAAYGLSGVSRLASFVAIPAVGLRLTIKLLTLTKTNITHVQPVITAEAIDYLRGGYFILTNFIPMFAVFLIYPSIKTPQKLGKALWVISVIVTVFFFISIFSSIGVFGADLLTDYVWPNLATVIEISLPYFGLEQVGFLFIVVWITMFFVGISFFLYLMINGLKEHIQKANYHLTLLILILIILIASMALPNMVMVSEIFKKLRFISLIPIVSYPLLVWLVSLIRIKERNKGGAK